MNVFLALLSLLLRRLCSQFALALDLGYSVSFSIFGGKFYEDASHYQYISFDLDSDHTEKVDKDLKEYFCYFCFFIFLDAVLFYFCVLLFCYVRSKEKGLQNFEQKISSFIFVFI